MPDETTPAETVEQVVEEVAPDPVTDPPGTSDESHSGDVSARIDGLEATINGLQESVNGMADQLAAVVTPQSHETVVDPVEETIDETPVKLPWTHRPLFGGRR